MNQPKVVTVPSLPRSDSTQAAAAIEQVMAERSWPCNPAAAARAGFEAARRLSEHNRLMTFSAQIGASSLNDAHDIPLEDFPRLRDQLIYWEGLYSSSSEQLQQHAQEIEQLREQVRRAQRLLESVDGVLAGKGLEATDPARRLLATPNPFGVEVFPALESAPAYGLPIRADGG